MSGKEGQEMALGLRAFLSYRWRRLLFFFAGAFIWTLFSCYPNPAVLVRNFLRYRNLPIDPKLEERMGWQLDPEPSDLEYFVDSFLVTALDWKRYRVPWYVPTADEVARTAHGDCEAKTILLVSLFEGRGLPYEIRASFNHIWVDYPGRKSKPGESAENSYIKGRVGKLVLRWPQRINWAELAVIQKQQLWEAMPLARKAIWIIGMLWVAIASLTLGGTPFKGDLVSNWRVRKRDYLARSLWTTALMLALIALVPSFQNNSTAPIRWTMADLREVLLLSVIVGAFSSWLSILHPRRVVTISSSGDVLLISSYLGWRNQSRQLTVTDIAQIELIAYPGGLRTWKIAAVLRPHGRVPLLHYHDELFARAALRQLGLRINRPFVIRSEGTETHIFPDEFDLSLRERSQLRPEQPNLPKPAGCGLEIKESEEVWSVGYPAVEGKAGSGFLGYLLIPAAILAITTGIIMRYPYFLSVWAGWFIAACITGLVTYLAIILMGEVVALLTGARVEIREALLWFHTPEKKIEAIPLDSIETVELGRKGENPTIAIVSPEKVIHLRGLCSSEHRSWLRRQIEQAVVKRIR